MPRHHTPSLYQYLVFGFLLVTPLAIASENDLEIGDQALCTVKSNVWLKRDGEVFDFSATKNPETFVIRRSVDVIEFPVRPDRFMLDTTLPFRISEVLGGEVRTITKYAKLVYDDGVLMYTTTAYSQIKAIVAHCEVFDG